MELGPHIQEHYCYLDLLQVGDKFLFLEDNNVNVSSHVLFCVQQSELKLFRCKLTT